MLLIIQDLKPKLRVGSYFSAARLPVFVIMVSVFEDASETLLYNKSFVVILVIGD